MHFVCNDSSTIPIRRNSSQHQPSSLKAPLKQWKKFQGLQSYWKISYIAFRNKGLDLMKFLRIHFENNFGH
jgi:hypothetical protein